MNLVNVAMALLRILWASSVNLERRSKMMLCGSFVQPMKNVEERYCGKVAVVIKIFAICMIYDDK